MLESQKQETWRLRYERTRWLNLYLAISVDALNMRDTSVGVYPEWPEMIKWGVLFQKLPL